MFTYLSRISQLTAGAKRKLEFGIKQDTLENMLREWAAKARADPDGYRNMHMYPKHLHLQLKWVNQFTTSDDVYGVLTMTLANIEVDEEVQGRGMFREVLTILETLSRKNKRWVYIESVINDHVHAMLKRRGYSTDNHSNYWWDPNPVETEIKRLDRMLDETTLRSKKTKMDVE